MIMLEAGVWRRTVRAPNGVFKISSRFSLPDLWYSLFCRSKPVQTCKKSVHFKFLGKYGNAGESARDFPLRKCAGEEGQMRESRPECGRVGNYVKIGIKLY